MNNNIKLKKKKQKQKETILSETQQIVHQNS